ncbi:MAG: hypothetical protein ACREPS_02540 [Rhodanobacteraceae bacterium]
MMQGILRCWRKGGYSAVRCQREVGAGYFDAVNQAIASGRSLLSAFEGSNEQTQFRRCVA